ncbi:MAG: bile acid:sodium symporter family protein [Bacteroidales bacterium]|nr:bile acid:sodium symporter family protein [Bacteroidales bacterium]MDT8432917.1 bile acid:sodium symporter family protein [Bacteroidales bacterium]
MKSIYKLILLLAIAVLLLFLASVFFDIPGVAGPALVAFFVLLAFGIRGHKFFRGFSYTVMIFSAVAIAMFYPGLFIKWGDFELKATIVPLLQIIMFGMGSQMSYRDFANVVKMPGGVLIGLSLQFTIMPIVGFTIATAFGFPPEIAAGIILVGSSPSGLASNVMSFIAKANLALSVTLTAFATILAPLLTPSLMKLFAGQFVPIDFWSMMLSIVNIVILPIVAGLMFNAIAYGKDGKKGIIIQVIVYGLIIAGKNVIFYFTAADTMNETVIRLLKDLAWFLLLPVALGVSFKSIAKGSKEYLDKALAFISMAGIGVIIVVITAAGRDSLLDIGLLLILACLLHNVTGYTLGYWICRLFRMDEKSCRTIALEVGMQNGGLASGIALEMGRVATIGLAPAVFGPMMNITGSSLATYWRDKKEKKK